jgi:hypothetical protein
MRQTAIQCTDRKTGRRGSFFFDDSAPLFATSPVFNNLVDLYSWDKYTTQNKGVIS